MSKLFRLNWWDHAVMRRLFRVGEFSRQPFVGRWRTWYKPAIHFRWRGWLFQFFYRDWRKVRKRMRSWDGAQGYCWGPFQLWRPVEVPDETTTA